MYQKFALNRTNKTNTFNLSLIRPRAQYSPCLCCVKMISICQQKSPQVIRHQTHALKLLHNSHRNLAACTSCAIRSEFSPIISASATLLMDDKYRSHHSVAAQSGSFSSPGPVTVKSGNLFWFSIFPQQSAACAVEWRKAIIFLWCAEVGYFASLFLSPIKSSFF